MIYTQSLSNQKIMYIIDNSDCACCVVSKKGKILYHNKKYNTNIEGLSLI